MRIVKVFEDFRLMAQLREEMDRLKNPALALVTDNISQTN